MLLIIICLKYGLLGGLKTTFSSYLLFLSYVLFLPTYFFMALSSLLFFISPIIVFCFTLPAFFLAPPFFAFLYYLVNLYPELFSLTSPTTPPLFASPLRFIVYTLYYLLDTTLHYTLHPVPWATFNFLRGGVWFNPPLFFTSYQGCKAYFRGIKDFPNKKFFSSKSFYKIFTWSIFLCYIFSCP